MCCYYSCQPTLDELLASGNAKKEVFHGKDLDERFHWKTRALTGEFSRSSPDLDTELGEGSLEAALLNFPAKVTITVVGKLSSNSCFVEDITRCIKDIASLGKSLDALQGDKQNSPLDAQPPDSGQDQSLGRGGSGLDSSLVDTGLQLEIKERSGGKYLSVQCTYVAPNSDIPSRVRQELRGVLGSLMVF